MAWRRDTTGSLRSTSTSPARPKMISEPSAMLSAGLPLYKTEPMGFTNSAVVDDSSGPTPKAKRTGPTWIWSPGLSAVRPEMRLPLTTVPRWLPRSSTNQLSRSHRIRQCRRETSGWLKIKSTSAARPTMTFVAGSISERGGRPARIEICVSKGCGS